ncbi:MAG TPA: hypothetical protein VG870_03070 [Chitinophagaceae bacterium]|nr:hypothetical protein [Chitinophagaceae bacterium]
MYIEINDTTRLVDVQAAFSNFYPYLQIHFYRKAHKLYESSDEDDRVSPYLTISQIKKTHASGILEILPLNRVRDVEHEFLSRFGLSVQILRREKQGWVQTTGLDDFSIKEVNELGRNSSDEYIVSDYEQGFEDTGD